MDDSATTGTVLDDVHQAEWPARPESVTAARRFVTSVLAGWGLSELTDTAALATSELVGNAVLHARTPFTLTVQYLRDGVLLRINDHCDQLPVVSEDGLLGAHGRGLHLLASVCDGWGATPDGDGGKAVWTLIRFRAPGSPPLLRLV